MENLSPTDSFSPSDWLYQQLCLELPHKQLCETKCPGIDFNEDAEETESSETISDSRWASLAALKRQLP